MIKVALSSIILRGWDKTVLNKVKSEVLQILTEEFEGLRIFIFAVFVNIVADQIYDAT